MNELIEQESKPLVQRQLTAVEIRSQINLIQEVMRSVMKEGTHYGVIPGTQKPSLYKPGSEVLLTTFRIAVDPEIQDLSNSDEARFRVILRGKHILTGQALGAGVGECSSGEDKYKWRKAVCDEEFEETSEDRRREKWKKGGYNAKPYKVKEVRVNHADVANTVLKMAKKRAQIDFTLTALAASDIFTQDIEDMPDELRPDAHTQEPKPPISMPQKKAESPKTVAGKLTVALIDLGLKEMNMAGGGKCLKVTFSDNSIAYAKGEAADLLKQGQASGGTAILTIEKINGVDQIVSVTPA